MVYSSYIVNICIIIISENKANSTEMNAWDHRLLSGWDVKSPAGKCYRPVAAQLWTTTQYETTK